jgi:type I restriction enzyme R subunit
MNEAETRAELIDPKLKACGWGIVEGSKVLREYNYYCMVKSKLAAAGAKEKLPIMCWFTKASNWQ